MSGTTFTITLHDPKQDTDDEIAERVAFGNAMTAEVLPDETPTPVAEAIAQLRSAPERVRRWSYRARDAEGRLAGLAGTSIDPEHDENPDVLWVNISVAADYRRKGLATRLLAELIELADGEGRTRLIGSTNDLRPWGAAFATAVGAEPKTKQHINRLMMADVDRALMERWVEEGPQRAPDYELIAWDGPVPEEHAQAYVDLVHVMNDAPRDDLDINDFTFSIEQLREMEKQMEAIGIETWVLVARHKSDGAFAGFHNVSWAPFDETIVHVGETGVRPEHRGHALGKWLKATMTLRVLDERPQVDQIRTGNADSNDAMLGINHAMGYKPWIATSAWEVAVDRAREFVKERLA